MHVRKDCDLTDEKTNQWRKMEAYGATNEEELGVEQDRQIRTMECSSSDALCHERTRSGQKLTSDSHQWGLNSLEV